MKQTTTVVIMAVILAVSMCLMAINTTPVADAEDIAPPAGTVKWDGTTIDTAWYVEDPSASEYVIKDGADLAGLAALVNGTDERDPVRFAGKTIIISDDIDLNDKEWTPIGNKLENSFLGTIMAQEIKDDSGNAHTPAIYNLKITDGEKYTGLFGYFLGNAKNVHIKNVEISGQGCVGGLAGNIQNMANRSIMNCSVENGYIRQSTGTDGDDVVGGQFGGILGRAYNLGGGIIGCSVSGVEIGGNRCQAGGIVGSTYNTNLTLCEVSGCELISDGEWGFSTAAGGIVGYAHASVDNSPDEGSGYVISGCTVTDTIFDSVNAANGGIIGYAATNALINNCSASDLKMNGDYIGGIIGYAPHASIIEGCSVTDSTFEGYHIGGLIGYIQTSTQSSIKDSVVIGMDVVSIDVNGEAHVTPANSYCDNVHYSDVTGDVDIDDSLDMAFIVSDGKYYPNIDSFKKDNAKATSATLVNGAVFTSDVITIDLVIPEGSTAYIPEGVAVDASSDYTITGAGVISVSGTLKLADMPRGGTLTYKGTGNLEVNSVSYPLEDIDWYIHESDQEEYVLIDGDDLSGLATIVNNGVDGFDEKHLSFRTDSRSGTKVDLSAYDWIPIGTLSNPFKGIFDGNGVTITGLKIENFGSNYVGLFGCVMGDENKELDSVSDLFHDNAFVEDGIDSNDFTAGILNVTLDGVTIDVDRTYVGAVAGHVENTYVYNIDITGHSSIKGKVSVGGIIGSADASVIQSCTTSEDVTVSSKNNENSYSFGGIVGTAESTNDATGGYRLGAIIGCENNADVSAYLTLAGMGGIAGSIQGPAPFVIYGCRNNGDVEITGNPEITTAFRAVAGGIVGMFPGGTDNVIANCENTGSVTSSSTQKSGSIAGIVNYYQGLVYGCENSGSVDGNAYFSGGIVGHAQTVTIDACTNHGIIDVDDGGYSATICAGSSNATFKNMTFRDVEDLGAAIMKATVGASSLSPNGAYLTLEEITVTDSSGVLKMPQYLNVFTSDRKVCGGINLEGDRNVYQQRAGDVNEDGYKPSLNNVDVSIAIEGLTEDDGFIVTLDGKIGARDHDGELNISGDHIDVVIEGGGVDTICILSGDTLTVTNHGCVGSISDYNYDDHQGTITIYNGTDDDRSGSLANITLRSMSAVVYNYGTMESDEVENGYILSIGLADNTGSDDPVIRTNTFEIHNYGTMEGNNISDQNYLFYIPAAESFKYVGYKGSILINNSVEDESDMNTWFIYYGLDGRADTDEGVQKGKFVFEYYSGTIKAYNTEIKPDINLVVGRDSGDVDITFVEIHEVTVSFPQYTGMEKQVIGVADGEVIGTGLIHDVAEGFIIVGFKMDGSDFSGAVYENIELMAKMGIEEPVISYEIQELNGRSIVTVNASHPLDVTFLYGVGTRGSDIVWTSENTFSVYEPGSYVLSCQAVLGADSEVTSISTTDVVVDVTSVPPFIPDDEDEWIPPVAVVEEQGGDSETVKVIACAAAAVVAALMAVYLIIDKRKG